MLLKLIHYIRGYVRIRVTGNSAERFLNACSHRGILLWGLRPAHGFYEMNLTIGGFRKLKPILRKTGTKVVILQRFGLPFFLHKYRKRKLFFLSAFLGILLLIWLSGFIWTIDIRGNSTRTDETILKFLENKKIKNGIRRSAIDCPQIAKDIRREYEDIIWVSASLEGTRLVLQIKENEDYLRTDKTKEPTEDVRAEAYNLVADYDCKITEMIVRKGLSVVGVGAEVKKGEILVTGNVPVKNDASEIISYQLYTADADVKGETFLPYEDTCSPGTIKKKAVGVKKEEYMLQIGNMQFFFGGIRNDYKDCEIYGDTRKLRFSEQFYLPVTFTHRRVVPYIPEKEKCSEEEIRKQLSGRFSRYCKELEKKGVEILQNDVKIYTGPASAVAKGNLKVILPIGRKAPAEVPEIPQNQENNQSGETIDGNDGNSN